MSLGLGVGEPVGRHDQTSQHPRVACRPIAAVLVGDHFKWQPGGRKQPRVVDEPRQGGGHGIHSR